MGELRKNENDKAEESAGEPVISDDWRQRLRFGLYVAFAGAVLMVVWAWAGKRGYFWGDPVPLSEAIWVFPTVFVLGFVAYVYWDYFNPRK